MRRSAGRYHGNPGLIPALAGILLAVLTGTGWGFTSAGVTLDLYVDEEHSDLKFALGQEPVKLILSIQNTSDARVVTERGYSQVELYNYLFVTDPAGVRHVLGQASTAHKMPPPFFINEKPWALAETLPAGWLRTVVIEDLRVFLPVMGETPGWYTIEARQPFVRFAQSGRDAGLGLLGLLDHGDNWKGTIKSRPLQVFIAPPMGAQLRLSVADTSADPPAPLSQVPVKVFKTAAIGSLSPAEAWGKTATVLSGTTALDGQVVWEEGAPCIGQGGFTAIAEVKGQYLQCIITPEDEGWQSACSGLLTQQIEAGGQAGLPISGFSVFALNSIYVQAGSIIHSGRVGTRDTRAGPWLDSRAEVAFGLKASVAPEVRVYGDTIFLGWGAMLYDVYYNELRGRGGVFGEKTTPLTLPIAEPPQLKGCTPGEENITVGRSKSKTLAPGAYKNVVLNRSATLNLSGGVYHFEDIKLGTAASVLCSGPAEIRIKNRFAADFGSYLGPSPHSGLAARDVVIHVAGSNISPMALVLKPLAAEFNASSQINANMFVPNGTLAIGLKCTATGAFVAKDIVVGAGSKIYHDSAF